jgi:GWxTD domain-containing protein
MNATYKSGRLLILLVLILAALQSVPSFAKSHDARQKPVLIADGGQSTYDVWLDQDVRWIITDEERAAYKMLQNDEERDDFIEAFWQRRNPTPKSLQNPYKIEHYLRIAYANEQFGVVSTPGWKTDRGRTYIMFGQPGEIEYFPTGKPKDDGSDKINGVVKDSFPRVHDGRISPGEDVSLLPLEEWHYRYLEGIGQDVTLDFVDACRCGDYRITLEPVLQKSIFQSPWGLTEASTVREESGSSRVPIGLVQYPPIKFSDLAAALHSRVILNPFPFEVRSDFAKATDLTSLVPITISVPRRDIKFVETQGSSHATLNIFGRLSTLTGRVTDEFEETVEVDPNVDSALPSESKAFYIVTIPLHSGRYRLEIAVKDVNADRKGIWCRSLLVPAYSQANRSTSSLVLAERVDRVSREVDVNGFFRIGSSYVRPYTGSIPGEVRIHHGAPVTAWTQVYGFAIGATNDKRSVTIDYDIIDLATKAAVFHDRSQVDSSDVMTLEKSLPVTSLNPASYRLDIRIQDEVSKATLIQSAAFVIE